MQGRLEHTKIFRLPSDRHCFNRIDGPVPAFNRFSSRIVTFSAKGINKIVFFSNNKKAGLTSGTIQVEVVERAIASDSEEIG